MPNLNSNQFKTVYDWLGLKISGLGCVMLDLEPLPNMHSIAYDGVTHALYTSENKERFWINGWIADKQPHITLLYGLLQKAPNYAEHIKVVLEGWSMQEAEIEDVDFFESPYEDEPYWCIIAKIKKDPVLMEGNQRLSFLPHINTFPTYTPHMTVCYVKTSMGEEWRDNLIATFKEAWVGKKMKVKPELNLGN